MDVVFEGDVFPWSYCKACVFGEFRITADEIGEGAGFIASELELGCFCWFEENFF